MPHPSSPNKLEVYSETRKRKTLVGTLFHGPTNEKWVFEYDKAYLRSKTAIPIGPELSLRQGKHVSHHGLFPSFADRIPSRENPAYKDYCASQGISVDEKNPIVLLTTIGKRGPSTFVFEPIEGSASKEDVVYQLRKMMEKLGLSSWDIATAFDLSQLTVQRILNGKSTDKNILRLIQIYMRFPEVALSRIHETGRRLSDRVESQLREYFSVLLAKETHASGR